jgi:hypothetical protein
VRSEKRIFDHLHLVAKLRRRLLAELYILFLENR